MVTGGTGLVGRRISEALREAGARVAIAARSRDKCEEVAEALGGLPVPMDITKPEEVARGVKAVVSRWKCLDVLVNAAGISRRVSLTQGSLADWLKVLNVNVTGIFLVSRAAAAVMMKQRRGKIINVASIYGIVGVDKRLYGERSGQAGTLAYTASKGAVLNLTRDMSIDMAPYQIQVNAISPGVVRFRQDDAFVERYADRTPLGRLADAADLKGAVIFLASSASDYITGQNIVLDGGFTAW